MRVSQNLWISSFQCKNDCVDGGHGVGLQLAKWTEGCIIIDVLLRPLDPAFRICFFLVEFAIIRDDITQQKCTTFTGIILDSKGGVSF